MLSTLVLSNENLLPALREEAATSISGGGCHKSKSLIYNLYIKNHSRFNREDFSSVLLNSDRLGGKLAVVCASACHLVSLKREKDKPSA